jgi:hypothetical protein
VKRGIRGGEWGRPLVYWLITESACASRLEVRGYRVSEAWDDLDGFPNGNG